MRLKYRTLFTTGFLLIFCAATAARADVTISLDPTKNVNCSGGVCTPSASNAVLNVGDLETLLATGNVTITTTGPGIQANSIDVAAKLDWPANALTLDAYQSLKITSPVTINGKSGLSILTDEGGSGGELAFSGKGHVTFRKMTGKLTINGTSYTLINSIASLAAAVETNPSGHYAFAGDYDASKDGQYNGSPIATFFKGSFEGLGNTISNLSVYVTIDIGSEAIGLFSESASGSEIRDITFKKAIFAANVAYHKRSHKRASCDMGVLVGENLGFVSGILVTGSVSATRNCALGGLAGINGGTVSYSATRVSVFDSANSSYDDLSEGGLVGYDYGDITNSSSRGNVTGTVDDGLGGLVSSGAYDTIEGSYSRAEVRGGYTTGGLIAFDQGGTIKNSFATGRVVDAAYRSGGLIGEGGQVTIESSYAAGNVQSSTTTFSPSAFGGLAGDLTSSESGSEVRQSFATGNVTGPDDSYLGGLIGYCDAAVVSNSYAIGSVKGGSNSFAGGLAGANAIFAGFKCDIEASYSAGVASAGAGSDIGGFVGADRSRGIGDGYWDTTTSGITNLSEGAGNIANDPGINGLSMEQLQSGLPAGFEPAVWSESANINNGLPYLLSNPPK
ncbi:MAG TPA: hypothetical protein VGK90_00085 [Rhizomicrobium sp.]|jgi:hypothetical protein